MSLNLEKTNRMWNESKRYLAGGAASSLRLAMKPLPLFAASGEGARIRDVDGNVYIDYLLAYGPLILGHRHPSLTEALNGALSKGVTFGLQHEGEIALAKLLTELLPCAERAALSGSGTEAVMLAVRLARAYTGKRRIVRFQGHYHGWSDTIFTSFPGAGLASGGAVSAAGQYSAVPGTGGQSERSLEEVIVLPWNDAEVLEQVLRNHSGDIAAVITEPVMCNSGCILPKPGYLEGMRELTRELGILMIMDEVITGFRMGLGGAHGRFGLMPDLVTVGKAMGGGISISGVAGSAPVMALIENGTVSHLGTLNGNCAATAAAWATLQELARDGGSCFARMEQTAGTLVQGIRDLLKRHGIPGVVNQAGPVFHLMFTGEPKVEDFEAFGRRDAGRYSRFAERLLEEGVLVRPNGLWYVSAVHGAEETNATLEAIDQVLAGGLE